MGVRLWPFLIIGGAVGACPPAVMEFLQPTTPAQNPAVITAFGTLMLAGAGLGFIAWMITDTRTYWRSHD